MASYSMALFWRIQPANGVLAMATSSWRSMKAVKMSANGSYGS